MPSRRNFVRTLSIAAATGLTVRWPLAGASPAASFEPNRLRETDGPIRLNSNENAYGPSNRAIDAMRSGTVIANRYPFAEYDKLVQLIARTHSVNPEQVLLGCGSTEILRVAALAFLGKGQRLVQASPTFEAMEYYARATDAEIVSVPLNREYAHDLDSMLPRLADATAMVYICNPNNPTASITPRTYLETFISRLRSTCHVLIDEAYHEYAGRSAMYVSFLDRPLKGDRVIVSRTFSKVYGLAGLRLGYGIASAATVKRMRAYATLDNVNTIAIRAAIAALEDRDSVREFVNRNADDRQEFFNQAMARMLKPIDSHANFVMMNTYHPAEAIIEHFRKYNVLIGRHFPPMDTYIRVSLGTREEMRTFWRVWDMLAYDKVLKHN